MSTLSEDLEMCTTSDLENCKSQPMQHSSTPELMEVRNRLLLLGFKLSELNYNEFVGKHSEMEVNCIPFFCEQPFFIPKGIHEVPGNRAAK